MNTTIKPVNELIKELAAKGKELQNTVHYEKTPDGLLAYVPIWFTTKGLTIYPAYEGIFPTFRIRSRFMAVYDYADHSQHSDALLQQLSKRGN